MIILPAIDIKNGKCVRLKQGLASEVTSYYDDPVEVAKMWEKQGAKYLHIVDLDGAFTGGQVSFDLIASIVKSVNIPVEVGGGIRSKETVQKYLSIGLDRVILGTKAVENMDFVRELCQSYPDKIAVSIDAKGDLVAIKGWVETSDTEVMPFAQDLIDNGVSTIIYTDISRDGMLSGPNINMLKKINELDVNIIASGGIADISHVKELMNLNLYGAITGKALYEGTLNINEINSLY